MPYDRRHVPTYHSWMQDPVRRSVASPCLDIFDSDLCQAILEATASEPLTLEEEYENQESWRASHDKLTFIICQPLETEGTGGIPVHAGGPDSPKKMVGDVNLFLSPYEEEDDLQLPSATPEFCEAEVDIMIAEQQHRAKGLGRAVMHAFLQYISRNLAGIMHEYADDKDMPTPPRLKVLMVKVGQINAGSIALFKSLGFEQVGGVDYFGELKLVLRSLDQFAAEVPEGYQELVYSRDNPNQDEQH